MNDLMEFVCDIMLILRVLLRAVKCLLLILQTTLITIIKFAMKIKWFLDEAWRTSDVKYL